MKKGNHTNLIILALTISMPILWFVFLGRYGWSRTDDGFILANSWRIFQGEIPYKDFIYVRPPLSPILHSLWFRMFPLEYVFSTARIFMLIQLSVSIMFFISSLGHIFKPTLKILIFIFSFIFSASAFTPMPWHTVDGLFFASAGIFAISKGFPFSSGLLIALAILSKQSFLPILIASLFFSILFLGITFAFRFLAGLSIPLLATISLLVSTNSLDAFKAQVFSAGNSQDLLNAGILSYLSSWRFWCPISTMLVFYNFLDSSYSEIRLAQKNQLFVKNIFKIALSFCICASILYVSYLNAHLPQVLFMTCFLSLVSYIFIILVSNKGQLQKSYLKDIYYYPFLFLLWLSLSWSTSISWGYSTPILFSAPFIAMIFTISNLNGKLVENFVKRRHNDFVFSVATSNYAFKFLGSLLALVLGVGFSFWAFRRTEIPYMDSERSGLNCDLGSVNRNFRFIISSPKNCELLQKANEIIKNFEGKKVIFLPTFTSAYFALQLKNPIASDWPMITELGSQMEISHIAQQINQNVEIAIIDRQYVDSFNAPGDRYHVPFMNPIFERWDQLSADAFFLVYKNPVETTLHLTK